MNIVKVSPSFGRFVAFVASMLKAPVGFFFGTKERGWAVVVTAVAYALSFWMYSALNASDVANEAMPLEVQVERNFKIVESAQVKLPEGAISVSAADFADICGKKTITTIRSSARKQFVTLVCNHDGDHYVSALADESLQALELHQYQLAYVGGQLIYELTLSDRGDTTLLLLLFSGIVGLISLISFLAVLMTEWGEGQQKQQHQF